MKGFIEPGPSIESLKPTPAEQARLAELLAWQEQSAKTSYLFGPSVGCPECHVDNNPNNVCCWHCGRALT
jgi:hypothetical protein